MKDVKGKAKKEYIFEDLNEFLSNRKYASLLKVEMQNLQFPSKEDKDKIKHNPNINLRSFPKSNKSIQLTHKNFDSSYYYTTSAKREYVDTPVSLKQLGLFLSLFKQTIIKNQPVCLYPPIAGNYKIKIYLYIKENGVEEFSEGLYYYDASKHTLIAVSSESSDNIKSSYTPYNRKHFMQAKFSLYLIAELGELKKIYKDKTTYLALLEAGYIGQLLLDKQVEFDMGVCPIGTLRFDKIRAAFNIKSEDELIHSFVCGPYLQEFPANWKFLDRQRSDKLILCSGNKNKDGSHDKQKGCSQSDIAIVGLSGRYPGAQNIDDLWENLKSGKTSFKEMKFSEAQQYQMRKSQCLSANSFTHLAAFLDDIDCFDCTLFNITPEEATNMDPQERLMLEVVWECLEKAGYTSQKLVGLSNKIGVFVGAMWDDYQHYAGQYWQSNNKNSIISSHHSSIANRISYYFDFSGPSISINTSCSSAMAAIHLACNSIKLGECNAAIVGGVNIMSHPFHYELLQKLDLLSKNGECHPFGMNGSGWIPGEGVGAILIKSLEDAERAKDYIHGIIKSTVIAHSGKTIRYGSPRSSMQKASIIHAIEKAHVAAETINYIEAAAPGACITDASEVTAIMDVFDNSTENNATVYIGSIKANIGHLESASTLSQLTKVLLQLKHGQISPTVGVKKVNPMIRLENSRIRIIDELKEWDCHHPGDDSRSENKHLPRRALINAFGATGTSGHAIIEEYVNHKIPKDERNQEHLILFSAATELQLKQLVKRFHEYLYSQSLSLIPLSDIAFTLQVGRVEMAKRLAIVANSHKELEEKLSGYLKEVKCIPGLFSGCVEVEKKSEIINDSDDLAIMGRKWVNGSNISLEALTKGSEKRVPLPTYPFAKERYWIHDEDITNNKAKHSINQISSSLQLSQNCKQSSELSREEKGKLFMQELISRPLKRTITDIEMKKDFFTLGLTSLDLILLASEMQKKINSEILPNVFFDYETISNLLFYLLKQYPESFDQLVMTKQKDLDSSLFDEDKVAILKSKICSPSDKTQAPVHDDRGNILEVLQQLENGNLDIEKALNLID